MAGSHFLMSRLVIAGHGVSPIRAETGFTSKSLFPDLVPGLYEPQLSEPRFSYCHPLGDRYLHDNLPLYGQLKPYVRDHHPGCLYDRIGCVPEKAW